MKIVELSDLPEEGVSHQPEIKKQVLFAKGELPHLTNFSRARLAPGQTAKAHSHRDKYEVFFVELGHGVIKIGGAEYPLEHGMYVVAEPGEEHEIINTGSAGLIVLYFGLEP